MNKMIMVMIHSNDDNFPIMIKVMIFLQGCGDVEAAGEESTLSLLHAYLRLVQVILHGDCDYCLAGKG